MRQTIVQDINNGKTINDLFNTFLAVKTKTQLDRLGKKIKGVRFGTYKQWSVLDVIYKRGVKDGYMQQEFMDYLKRVIN